MQRLAVALNGRVAAVVAPYRERRRPSLRRARGASSASARHEPRRARARDGPWRRPPVRAAAQRRPGLSARARPAPARRSSTRDGRRIPIGPGIEGRVDQTAGPAPLVQLSGWAGDLQQPARRRARARLRRPALRRRDQAVGRACGPHAALRAGTGAGWASPSPATRARARAPRQGACGCSRSSTAGPRRSRASSSRSPRSHSRSLCVAVHRACAGRRSVWAAGRPSGVLPELRVENLLLIERAELRLAPGLNVLTGETGAGKTVLAHALDLLLGGRPRPGIVRPGAAEAYVEGVVRAARRRCASELAARRRLARRTPTRSCSPGGSAPTGARAPTSTAARRPWPTCSASRRRLLSFYGQHEHRRLTLASAQLDLLDAFCGPEHLARRARVRAARHAACASSSARARRAARDGGRARARARPAGVRAGARSRTPRPTRPSATRAAWRARERLRHLEALRAAALGAAQAAAPDEGTGAVALLAAAGAALDARPGVDAGARRAGRALARRGARGRGRRGASCAATPRGWTPRPEGRRRARRRRGAPGRPRPARAQARRHDRGGPRARRALPRAPRRAGRRRGRARQAATAELAAARAELAERAGALRAARAKAAPQLAARRARAPRRAGDGGRDVRDRAGASARTAGADAAPTRSSSCIAPNAGVPAAPLRETASGGELSRVMLALLGVANDGSQATLVFDEVDAGIGGQTARAVGEQLRVAGRGPPGRLHHPPAADRLARRAPLLDREGRVAPSRRAPTVRELDERRGRRRARADARRRRGRRRRAAARAELLRAA